MRCNVQRLKMQIVKRQSTYKYSDMLSIQFGIVVGIVMIICACNELYCCCCCFLVNFSSSVSCFHSFSNIFGEYYFSGSRHDTRTHCRRIHIHRQYVIRWAFSGCGFHTTRITNGRAHTIFRLEFLNCVLYVVCCMLCADMISFGIGIRLNSFAINNVE